MSRKMFLIRNSITNLASLVGGCYFHYPFRYIVYNYKYVNITKGFGEKSHEIYVPQIKQFNLQNISECHLLFHGDSSYLLAPITSFHKSISIFV